MDKMYRTMVQLQNADQILYDLQRQGSISFYMTGARAAGAALQRTRPLTVAR